AAASRIRACSLTRLSQLSVHPQCRANPSTVLTQAPPPSSHHAMPVRFLAVDSAVPTPEMPDDEQGLPIRMLHDRVLVKLEGKPGERRSTAGIVIPATATMGRRLAWATAVA